MDIDIGEFTRAAWIGDLEKIKEFVKNGVDVNINNPTQLGMTALMEASKKGHLEVVKYLSENGADVNIESEHGWTALLVATEGRQIDVIKYLVEKGAYLNHKENVYRNSALTLASKNVYLEIVEYLVDKGASTFFMTIVDFVKCGWISKVKEEIENGANPNRRINLPYDDGRGTILDADTLLITASYYGYVEIVKYLLEKGADTSLIGHDFDKRSGKTALMCAKEKNHTKIIKLLKDAGAIK